MLIDFDSLRDKSIEEQVELVEQAKRNRINALKASFESSGKKQNFADSAEIDELLTLTEIKIIQQCKRPECHECKLGWICPKYWSK